MPIESLCISYIPEYPSFVILYDEQSDWLINSDFFTLYDHEIRKQIKSREIPSTRYTKFITGLLNDLKLIHGITGHYPIPEICIIPGPLQR